MYPRTIDVHGGTRIISPQTVTMDTPGKAISSPSANTDRIVKREACVYV